MSKRNSLPPIAIVTEHPQSYLTMKVRSTERQKTSTLDGLETRRTRTDRSTLISLPVPEYGSSRASTPSRLSLREPKKTPIEKLMGLFKKRKSQPMIAGEDGNSQKSDGSFATTTTDGSGKQIRPFTRPLPRYGLDQLNNQKKPWKPGVANNEGDSKIPDLIQLDHEMKNYGRTPSRKQDYTKMTNEDWKDLIISNLSQTKEPFNGGPIKIELEKRTQVVTKRTLSYEIPNLIEKPAIEKKPTKEVTTGSAIQTYIGHIETDIDEAIKWSEGVAKNGFLDRPGKVGLRKLQPVQFRISQFDGELKSLKPEVEFDLDEVLREMEKPAEPESQSNSSKHEKYKIPSTKPEKEQIISIPWKPIPVVTRRPPRDVSYDLAIRRSLTPDSSAPNSLSPTILRRRPHSTYSPSSSECNDWTPRSLSPTLGQRRNELKPRTFEIGPKNLQASEEPYRRILARSNSERTPRTSFNLKDDSERSSSPTIRGELSPFLRGFRIGENRNVSLSSILEKPDLKIENSDVSEPVPLLKITEDKEPNDGKQIVPYNPKPDLHLTTSDVSRLLQASEDSLAQSLKELQSLTVDGAPASRPQTLNIPTAIPRIRQANQDSKPQTPPLTLKQPSPKSDLENSISAVDPDGKLCILDYIESYNTDPLVTEYINKLTKHNYLPLTPENKEIEKYLNYTTKPIPVHQTQQIQVLNNFISYFQSKYFFYNVKSAADSNVHLFSPLTTRFRIPQFHLLPEQVLNSMTEAKKELTMAMQIEAGKGTQFIVELLLLRNYDILWDCLKNFKSGNVRRHGITMHLFMVYYVKARAEFLKMYPMKVINWDKKEGRVFETTRASWRKRGAVPAEVGNKYAREITRRIQEGQENFNLENVKDEFGRYLRMTTGSKS